MISLNGVILLNYVSPDYRFKCVSKAMLNHMEEFAKNIGILMCNLQITYTYKDFYNSAGYQFKNNNEKELEIYKFL